jgi:glycosyltransferase involved in cell wall biosynthesis
MPTAAGDVMADLNLRSPLSVLRVPGLIGRAHDRLARLTGSVDHVVAVCEWVAEVLRRNDVPDDKLTLSRQGLPDQAPAPDRPAAKAGSGPLRIAYFGRLDWTKGVGLLATALALRPWLDVSIDLFLVTQPGSNEDLRALQAAAEKDRRLSVHPPVPPREVSRVMSRFDLVAVPSRWMETGPLVVLEAFAAGVPVLGADRGGIRELVEDGVTGALFAAGDGEALAHLLEKLAGQRELIEAWRRNIKPPRTMRAVVAEMAQLYRRLLQPRNGAALPMARDIRIST